MFKIIDLILKSISGVADFLNEQAPQAKPQENDIFQEVGAYGEQKISEILKGIEERHIIFNNLYIPTGHNNWAEIDIVFLHHTGIYVFESKNFAGQIIGTSDDKNWIKISKGAKEYFYNPVKQNQTHITALYEYLKIQIPMYSIIVFSNDCNLELVAIKESNTYVIKNSEITKLIKYLIHNRKEMEDEIFLYITRGLKNTNSSEYIRKKHLENVRKYTTSNKK